MRRLALFLVLSLGCKPELGSPASLVAGLRILGVKTEPPEVMPGAPVKSELLAVDEHGRVTAPVDWSLCLAHKPPAENNIVARSCAGGTGDLMPVLDRGLQAGIDVPGNACALNGPDAPPVKPGEPPLRARDADITGGYYQPIGVKLREGDETATAFALERITCNLPNVSVDVAKDFVGRYHPNQNPVLVRLTANGAEVPAGAMSGATFAPGQMVTFEVAWTPASRETFPVYEPVKMAIVDHAEELTVSWFASAGEFDRDRTGRTELESETSISNGWLATPPASPGPVHLWLVLRDNRGGLDFQEYLVTVGP
jgi:hypothetical protein